LTEFVANSLKDRWTQKSSSQSKAIISFKVNHCN